VSRVSGIEDPLALAQDGGRMVAVHHGRGEQGQRGMAVLVVVPGEETLAEGAAVLNAAKAIREVRAVLHGAEMTDFPNKGCRRKHRGGCGFW